MEMPIHTPQTHVVHTPTSKPKNSGLMVFFLIILGGGLALSVLLNFVLFIGVISQGTSSGAPFIEETVSGQGPQKIVYMNLEGVIASGTEQFSTFISSDIVTAMFDQALQDDSVVAVLAEFNTPGGSVGASDKINHKIQSFQKSSKPVYVLMGDVCASGGVYATTHAKKIFAHPTTMTGSIGVILKSYNFEKLMQNIGVKDVVIKSGAMKDILNPTRSMKAAEEKVLQEFVFHSFERFKKLLAEGRGLSLEQIQKVSDGRIFTADQALALGLIDQIGYYEDVLADMKQELAFEKVKIVRYKRMFSLFDFAQTELHTHSEIEAIIKWLSVPKALYMMDI